MQFNRKFNTFKIREVTKKSRKISKNNKIS